MSLNYVLIVNSAINSQGAYSAWQFANELIKQQHNINQIFFYQQGISNTNALMSPASDEVNVVSLWQAFSRDTKVPLISCVAASLRRGVVDQSLAKEQHLPNHNLASGFRLGGLGEFVTASAMADILVQF